MNNVVIKDNGGRRLGIDGKEFSCAVCLPERRSGKDRRGWFDRRSSHTNESRSDIERRTTL